MRPRNASIAAAAFLAAAVFSCAAGAAPAPSLAPTFDELKRGIDSCAADGAFGFRFGDRRPGAHLQLTATPQSWAPFASFTISVTYSSQRIFQVLTELDFLGESKPEDERHAEAKAIVDAAEAYIQSTHRFAKRKVEAADGSVEYFSDASEKSGISLWLWLNRYVIMIACTDQDLQTLSMKEGIADVAQPRPERVKIAPPKLPLPRFSENECMRPKSRAARIAAFVKNQTAMINYAGAMASYFSRLEDDKGAQLVAKGVWSDADKSRFALTLFDDPEFAAEAKHGLALIAPYTDALGRFDDARKRHDAAGACKAAVAANAVMHDLAETSEKQALRVLALYQMEAERLGVRLE